MPFGYDIFENAIRCKQCNSIIKSRTVHDYVSCGCQAVAVDGGVDYLRRIGDIDEYEELSVFKKWGQERLDREKKKMEAGSKGFVDITFEAIIARSEEYIKDYTLHDSKDV